MRIEIAVRRLDWHLLCYRMLSHTHSNAAFKLFKYFINLIAIVVDCYNIIGNYINTARYVEYEATRP